jgi:hypothetical protein
MRRDRHTDDANAAAIEALLRSAASYEPDTPAPVGAALRALGSRQRCPVRCHFRLWLPAAAAMAALSAAAMLLTKGLAPHLPAPPAATATLATTRGTVAPSADSSPRPPAPCMVLARGIGRQPHPGAAVPAAALTPRHRGHRTGSRVEARRAAPPPSRVAPRVRWHRQRVPRYYYAGYLEPAWLAEPSPEGEGIVLTPVVVDVPAQMEDGTASAGERPATIMPARYEPPH